MNIRIEGRLPTALGITKARALQGARLFARLSGSRIGAQFQDVTVIVQDDASSAGAHLAIMGVEGATDVITQQYDPMPGEEPGVYGELYVNAEQALRVARKSRGWSSAKEFLLYIAHGMDHLSGADDHSNEDYARMRRRELSWLRQFTSN